MTNSDLKTLIDFHYWARDRMLTSVPALPSDQYVKPMGNSFSSIRDTLVHLLSGERVWQSRWTGTSPMSHLNPVDFPDLSSLTTAWQSLESDVRSFVGSLSDTDIDRVFEFK